MESRRRIEGQEKGEEPPMAEHSSTKENIDGKKTSTALTKQPPTYHLAYFYHIE